MFGCKFGCLKMQPAMIEILDRIKIAANATSDAELARKIEISQQSIAKARTTKNVPFSWLPKISTLFDVSLDWLYSGTGSMRPSDLASAPQQAIEQPTVVTKVSNQCPRCTELEKDLEKKNQYIEDINKNLVEALQNSMLLTEKNGELRLENLKLTHQLDTARQMCREYAQAIKEVGAKDPIFDEPQNIASSDPLHIR